MSVTPPVSHVEMWPYVASAAVASESHSLTAVLMVFWVMTLLMVGCGVGRGEDVGADVGVVDGSGVGGGESVGRGVGTRQLYPLTPQV